MSVGQGHLSPTLRRQRRVRAVIGLALGLVCSSCVMFLITQLSLFSFLTYERLPWYGGIVTGAVVSVLMVQIRTAAKRLRIRMLRSTLGLLALVAFGTTVTSTDPAAAQDDEPLAECEVLVTGQAVSGQQLMTRTTRSNPLVLDPDVAGPFFVEWGLPAGVDSSRDQSGEPRRWRIGVQIAGFDRQVHEETAESGEDGTYRLAGLDSGLVPGVYPVWGEFDGVCDRQFGYVKILGSPWSVPEGWIATIGAVASALGLVGLLKTSGGPMWSFSNRDRVTIEILDPTTGEVVKDSLVRGRPYVAKVSIDFPDPPAAYLAMPGPVDLHCAVLGSTASVAPASLSPATGVSSANIGFEVPNGAAGVMQLQTDVSVGGNLIQSVRVIETVGGGDAITSVSRGLGQLVYKAGEFTAKQLCSIRPVDATIVLHGSAGGGALEVWGLRGYNSMSLFARNRVTVEDLADAAGAYRAELKNAIASWHTAGSEADAMEATRRLAVAGARIRALVLGENEAPSAPDGSILIANDTNATGSMTFPWNAFYAGEPPTDGAAISLCDETVPDHDHNDPDVICPLRFWGLRYELVWPNGWSPRSGDGSLKQRAGLFSRLKRAGSINQRLLPNLLQNDLPIEISSVVDPKLQRFNRLAEVTSRPGVEVTEVSTFPELRSGFGDHLGSSHLVYCLAHGVSTPQPPAGPTATPPPPGSAVAVAGAEVRDAFGLSFDNYLLDGMTVRSVAGKSRLEEGPIVILNACQSGVIEVDEQHGLLDAIRGLGARAVIVTETPVLTSDATVAVNRVIDRVLGGSYVSRALLEARREEPAVNDRLATLSYSYYGPPGLRLTTPVAAAYNGGPAAPPPPDPQWAPPSGRPSAVPAAPRSSAAPSGRNPPPPPPPGRSTWPAPDSLSAADLPPPAPIPPPSATR